MDKTSAQIFLNENLNSMDECVDKKYYDQFKLGLRSYGDNKHASALEHFERSVEIAKEVGNPTLEFFGVYGLGCSYALIMQYRKTIDCFEKCVDILELSGNNKTRKMCFAYNAVGDGNLFIGNFTPARDFYRYGVEIAKYINDKEIEMTGYLKMARVNKIAFSYKRAIDYYEKCLEIAKEEGHKSSILQAKQGLGDLYKLKGQFSIARKYFEEFLKIACELNDTYRKSLAYAALGDVCWHTGQLPAAFGNYEKCLNSELAMCNTAIKFRAYLGQGYAFFHSGKYLQAFENFKECYQIVTESRDPRLQASLSLVHGDMYCFTENYSKGIECYNYSLHIATMEETFHDIKRAGCFRLGNACTETGKFSVGREHLEKCLELSMKVEDQYHECQAYLGLGDVDIAEERYDAGISNFLKGLDIAAKICERSCESRASRSLGDAHILMSSYDKAKTYYHTSLKIAEEIESTKERSRSHFGLAKVLYKSSEDYQEAKKHYKEGFKFAAVMSGINLEHPLSSAGADIDDEDIDDDCIDDEGIDNEGIDTDAVIHYNPTDSAFGALVGYWEFADVCYKLSEYDEAIKLVERYLEIVEETGDIDKKEKACKRLVDIYQQQGRNYMMKQFQQKLLLIAQERERANLGMYAWFCERFI